jgi:Dockerin type I domain
MSSGIVNDDGQLTVDNCIITGNTGPVGGGIDNFLGTVTIENSTITGNTGQSGGGIYNYGTLSVGNSIISDNTVKYLIPGHNIVGGGICIVGTSTLTVTNSTISGNSAPQGGGIFQNSGTLSLTNSTVSGNSATLGGGIFQKTGTLSLTNSTVSGNSASDTAGGIYGAGTLAIVNSTLTQNMAPTGAAIRAEGSAMLTVVDSTVSGNTTSNVGGAVAVYGNSKGLINGTIVAANSGGDFNLDIPAGAVTGSSNLVGDGSDGGVLANSLRGSLAKPLNPLLSPLGNFGGPTQTLAPLPGSPVLGMGAYFNLTTDQRGFARPTITGIDIGADQGALFAGDANLDGTVNITDLLVLLNNYNQTGKDWEQGDFNFDGTVNITDLLLLLNNYNDTASDTANDNSTPAVIAYKANVTPFAGEPLGLNAAGRLVGQTSGQDDADGGILEPTLSVL